MDVSYIVPVYNALPRLERTVESLLGQAYDPGAFELLFVDDGSTDGSGAFLDELARDFPQMRVFHIPASGGPSTPRNVGLARARGDYVFFCDADDWMEPDATARMMGHAREWRPDVMLVKPKGEDGRRIALGAFDETLADADVFRSGVGRALGPCKLFDRRFMEENRIAFTTDLPVWEDQPVVLKAYLLARRVSVAADGVYCHWTAGDGGGSSGARENVSFDDVVLYLDTMLSLLGEHASVGDACEVIAPRVLREGLFYAAQALHREGDAIDRDAAFARLRALTRPYLSDAFHRTCNVQRSLMFEAFRSGDAQAWMAVCLEERGSDRFKPGSFEVDDAAGRIEAVWRGAGGVQRIDARGRLPLGFELTGLAACGRDALALSGTMDGRACYGLRDAKLRLVKRNRGEWVELPLSVEGKGRGRRAATAEIPLSALVGEGRALFWDASVVATYENGRAAKQRVRAGGALAAGGWAAMADPARPVGGKDGGCALGDAALIVAYATKSGHLGLMDCLLDATLQVKERLIGSSIALKGVPGRAYEVLGRIEIALTRDGARHVVGFESAVPVPVRFKAGPSPAAEVLLPDPGRWG